MAKHTPGPWHIEAGTHYQAIRTDGEVIANMREIGGCFNKENARLIAAAPDLLAALESMLDWDTTLEAIGFAVKNGVKGDIAKARAAIAKATGN